MFRSRILSIAATIYVVILVVYSCSASFCNIGQQPHKENKVRWVLSPAPTHGDTCVCTKVFIGGHDPVTERYNTDEPSLFVPNIHPSSLKQLLGCTTTKGQTTQQHGTRIPVNTSHGFSTATSTTNITVNTEEDLTTNPPGTSITSVTRNTEEGITTKIIATSLLVNPEEEISNSSITVNAEEGTTTEKYITGGSTTCASSTNSIVTTSSNPTSTKVYSVYTCEGGTASFECRSNQIINVIVALYGRKDDSICHHSSIGTLECEAADSLRVIQDLCNGRQSCSVQARSYIFGGDPCEGTYKYLQVQYNCEHCVKPLGMESGEIADSQISVSHNISSDTDNKNFARLHNGYHWSADLSSSPWIQVTFHNKVHISGIILQGYHDSWVQCCTIDVNNSIPALEYAANFDGDTPVTILFEGSVESNFIKVIPSACYYNKCHVRMEILGPCDDN